MSRLSRFLAPPSPTQHMMRLQEAQADRITRGLEQVWSQLSGFEAAFRAATFPTTAKVSLLISIQDNQITFKSHSSSANSTPQIWQWSRMSGLFMAPQASYTSSVSSFFFLLSSFHPMMIKASKTKTELPAGP